MALEARAVRIQHGRFYTPESVAELVLSLVLGDRSPPRRLVDPSCGDGVFLRAARRRGIAAGRLFGRDIDAEAARAAQAASGADIAVADLFDPHPLDGRFDAVVGNPPYVRQERLGAAAKNRIAGGLAAVHPGTGTALWSRLVGRGDLAACAVARAVALLAPGGRLGFVVSSALLEADYAAPLWQLLASEGRVLALVASPAERWFAEAAVNTAILIYERGTRGGPATVARLSLPVAGVAARVRSLGDLGAVAELRRGEGSDPASLARLIRAPSAWLDLAASLGDRLVPLGELAEIRRGVTAGANDVFYMTAAAAGAEGIEPELLAPLVRAPGRGAASIAVDGDALADRLLVAPADLGPYPGARRYFEARAHVAARPSLRSRTPWWRIPRRRRARIFLTKAYDRRFIQRYCPVPLDCDQRVYAVEPRAGLEAALLAAALNGTATALAIEALGRASMGEGALEWTVADARALPVIDVRRAGDPARIAAAFRVLAHRPIGAAADEVGRSDREALDRSLLSDIDARATASALAEAVALRVRRAASVAK
jgi:methylase of polypeptide subunit release factors